MERRERAVPRMTLEPKSHSRPVSASARLREMDAAMPNEPWSRESGEWFKIGLSPVAGTSADALAIYRNALPELAALVEAADPDTEGSAHWLCMGTVAMVDGSRQSCPICEALERLARKLGEQG